MKIGPILRRSLALTACAAVGVLGTTGASAARGQTNAATPPHDPSTILVKFARAADAAPAIAAHGDRHLGSTATRVDIVKIAPGASVAAKVAAYSALRSVVYAEPNYVAHASLAAPNDPSYTADWGMGKIGAVQAWTVYPGAYTSTGGVPVAVVDTGVQATHPDLSGRVQTGLGADCLISLASCTAGSAADDNGHGTHVAGIVGAATNNAVGVAGVAYSSPIIPVKVLNSNGSGSYDAITNGIAWAVLKGAKVINMSLGGGGFSQTLCDAVTNAINKGVLVVAAAGNNGSSAASYPAACPGTVGVAATDSNEGSPSWSNYGSPNVFVSAPGASIYSTYFGSSYSTLSGTSMASPFVAGLAALLFGQVPLRTPADVKKILATTSSKVGGVTYGADPYGTCAGCTWNQDYGYGRIDAAGALGVAAPPDGPKTSTFAVTAGGDDGNVGPNGALSYPPATAANPNSTGPNLTAGRRYVFGGYDVFATLLRFDTSSLPDDATITGVTLRMYVTRKADSDNRNLVG
ncbi:MAG: thermitase, partial [Gaiellaceae bacterium]|nr:thermitase [Gaiellaceae bacterium]